VRHPLCHCVGIRGGGLLTFTCKSVYFGAFWCHWPVFWWGRGEAKRYYSPCIILVQHPPPPPGSTPLVYATVLSPTFLLPIFSQSHPNNTTLPDSSVTVCSTCFVSRSNRDAKGKAKGSVWRLMEIHLTPTECHLPYGITQCYLPPDTSEHTSP